VLKFRFWVLCCLTCVATCWLNIQQISAAPTQLNPQPLLALPLEQVRYDYYPIAGQTANELRSQMLKNGPVDRLENRRYDAETRWAINWSYQYKEDKNQCAIVAIRGEVTTTFVLPQWKPPRNTSPTLIAEWQRYKTALQVHEDGHKNHGVSAAKEVLQALGTLRGYPSCSALDAAVKDTTQAVIQTYNQRDITYDHQTRHGVTQGAVFPSRSAQSLASQG
jgi:predicted secreted Zn-dependent protease